MRDNIEVEGQIKRRRKKFCKPVSDWTANFWGYVAEFLNVGSFRRNIFAKVRSSTYMTLQELIGCNFWKKVAESIEILDINTVAKAKF